MTTYERYEVPKAGFTMTTSSSFPTQNIDPRYTMQGMATIQARAAAMKARAQSQTAVATSETAATDGDATGQTTALGSQQSNGDVDKLLGQFQSIMFTEMMKAMRSTVPKSELFKKSNGEETFESFLDEQYANAASLGVGGLGLTKALKRQLGLGDDNGKTLSPELVNKKNQTAATQAARSESAILTEKE